MQNLGAKVTLDAELGFRVEVFVVPIGFVGAATEWLADVVVVVMAGSHSSLSIFYQTDNLIRNFTYSSGGASCGNLLKGVLWEAGSQVHTRSSSWRELLGFEAVDGSGAFFSSPFTIFVASALPAILDINSVLESRSL